MAVLFTLFAKQLVQNWQLTLTFFASFNVSIVCGMVMESGRFSYTEAAGDSVERYTYKDAVKDPFLWKFGLAFASFLTLYVLSLVSFKAVFDEYTLVNGSIVIFLISGSGILGTFVGIAIGNKGLPRRPTLFMVGLIMVGSFTVTLLFANVNPTISYIFAAVCGFACYVQYPIFLNLPHELKGYESTEINNYVWFVLGDCLCRTNTGNDYLELSIRRGRLCACDDILRCCYQLLRISGTDISRNKTKKAFSSKDCLTEKALL